MDEKLKQKLALLGEPALPERLTAEELFRRMDSGELTLPEEELPCVAQPSFDQEAILWPKLLRRTLPIAACLALVVLLSQGGLWKAGFSGGAALSENTAADQAAPADSDQGAPIANYSLDPDEQPVEPAARAIPIEDDAEEEEAAEEEDIADAVNADDIAEGIATDDAAEETARGSNSEQKSAVTADSAEEVQVNPDIGIPSPDEESPFSPSDFAPLLEEIGSRLYLQDEALTGLTPFLTSYGPMYTMEPDSPDPFNGWFYFENDEGKVAALRVVHCTINWEADGTYSLTLLSFEEWDRERREEWLPGMYLEWADVLS